LKFQIENLSRFPISAMFGDLWHFWQCSLIRVHPRKSAVSFVFRSSSVFLCVLCGSGLPLSPIFGISGNVPDPRSSAQIRGKPCFDLPLRSFVSFVV
jgi:hypothetical protein